MIGTNVGLAVFPSLLSICFVIFYDESNSLAQRHQNKRSFDKIYLKIVQNAILQSEERPEGVGANERDEKIKREWK